MDKSFDDIGSDIDIGPRRNSGSCIMYETYWQSETQVRNLSSQRIQRIYLLVTKNYINEIVQHYVANYLITVNYFLCFNFYLFDQT